mgnify:CR=1 FL=1
MAVPYIFANVTTTIPLSQLDNNFATAITLGNTAVYLGNTTTTLGNVTLSNVNVASGIANVSNLTATNTVTFSGTGAVQMTSGTTAQRPTPASGQLRFNTDTTQFEGYNGSAWASVGGATISNDTSTSSNEYPLFASATSGTALTVYTSNTKLLYKPSTGEFSASAPVASNGIFVNNATVGSSYTIASGYNGHSVGPMTIASGQSVTVSSGQRWLVL